VVEAFGRHRELGERCTFAHAPEVRAGNGDVVAQSTDLPCATQFAQFLFALFELATQVIGVPMKIGRCRTSLGSIVGQESTLRREGDQRFMLRREVVGIQMLLARAAYDAEDD